VPLVSAAADRPLRRARLRTGNAQHGLSSSPRRNKGRRSTAFSSSPRKICHSRRRADGWTSVNVVKSRPFAFTLPPIPAVRVDSFRVVSALGVMFALLVVEGVVG
jgi:hypothetical protein